jgi:hypothetical protein
MLLDNSWRVRLPLPFDALLACFLLQYIELVDTVFLCLRKKSTPFIHVYHHAITLQLCWTQLASETCMQSVHVHETATEVSCSPHHRAC